MGKICRILTIYPITTKRYTIKWEVLTKLCFEFGPGFLNKIIMSANVLMRDGTGYSTQQIGYENWYRTVSYENLSKYISCEINLVTIYILVWKVQPKSVFLDKCPVKKRPIFFPDTQIDVHTKATWIIWKFL